jgi:hypothetical protein
MKNKVESNGTFIGMPVDQHGYFERMVLGEWKPVECKSCGIKLSYSNTKDGHECMMCAIPMASIENKTNGGIIATHY